MLHDLNSSRHSFDSVPAATPDLFSGEFQAALPRAIERTQQWLLSQQHADGYWVAELQGDSILQSEFLLLLAFLCEERSPLALKCAKKLLESQTAEGFWNQYPGAPIDISATVKSYFAL